MEAQSAMIAHHALGIFQAHLELGPHVDMTIWTIDVPILVGDGVNPDLAEAAMIDDGRNGLSFIDGGLLHDAPVFPEKAGAHGNLSPQNGQYLIPLIT